MSRVALVLCGGKGTRFRSISSSPKILAPFRNGLFIDWLIDFLKNNQFETIILSLGYKSEEIIEYINLKFNSFNISYLLEEVPLGTGGAVSNAFNLLKNDELCVFNGDTFWTENLDEEFFSKKIELGLCLTKVFPVNDRYGELNLNNGKLSINIGSTTQKLYNSKVFIGIARVSRSISSDGLMFPYSFEELLLSQKEGLDTFNFNGDMFDFGIPDAYKIFGEKYAI
jgi:D-glycero-alpha-D-manno-heptose 1-phosphate guanylyltransferase